jgi:hypothetical protein
VTDHQPEVWVLLVERGLDAGSDLQLYWNEAGAIRAAREYLSKAWPDTDLSTGDRVYEAIEEMNQAPAADEYLVLAAFPVTGDGKTPSF